MDFLSWLNWPVVILVSLFLGVFIYFRTTTASIGLEDLNKLFGRKSVLFFWASLLWSLAFGMVVYVYLKSTSANLSFSELTVCLKTYGYTLTVMLVIGIGGNTLEWMLRAIASFSKNPLPDPKDPG